jgi:hypothetical protein
VYGGDSNDAGSTSPAVTQTVATAASTTTLATSVNPTTYGASTTLTASVTPSGATGTFTFKDGGTTIGTATVGHGSGNLAVSNLGVASHSLTAVYSGDSNYLTSTSNTVSQVVNQLTSSTAVTSSQNPSTYGQSVTFTATVTPSSAGGTVTFKDGSITLGSATLGHGSGAYATSTLAAGSHSITAVYGGDSNDAGSTSPAVTQTVATAASTTTLATSVNPTTYGASTMLTVSVTPSGATGTFTFKDGESTIGTASVGHGSGTLVVSNLPVGSHSLTVVYGGDANYQTSTSNAITQWISEAPPPPPSPGSHRGSAETPRSLPLSASPSLNPVTPRPSPSPSLPAPSSSLQQRIEARRKAREQRIRPPSPLSTNSPRSAPLSPQTSSSQSPSAAPPSYRVTTPYLNFRTDARVTSRIKDTLREADTITVLRFVQNGQWAEVQLRDGRTGYVSAAFIENVKQ